MLCSSWPWPCVTEVLSQEAQQDDWGSLPLLGPDSHQGSSTTDATGFKYWSLGCPVTPRAEVPHWEEQPKNTRGYFLPCPSTEQKSHSRDAGNCPYSCAVLQKVCSGIKKTVRIKSLDLWLRGMTLFRRGCRSKHKALSSNPSPTKHK
jgi:hypothetical protein